MIFSLKIVLFDIILEKKSIYGGINCHFGNFYMHIREDILYIYVYSRRYF